MDFLDPQKERAHKIRIMTGYVLIAIALVLTTVVLLYQAYGFGVDKNGNVIQSGLVFISSTPTPAHVFINGTQNPKDTNTRLLLSSGQYNFDLKRAGYRDWHRAITVEGGSVERFDYPMLFPTTLTTTAFKTYPAAKQSVQFATESPDRHWLLVQPGNDEASFDVYDLSNAKNTIPNQQISIPTTAFSPTQANTSYSWELIQWSTDNQHVVLRHSFQKAGQAATEYVLVDRQDPTKSVNLTSTWGMNPTQIEMKNQAYDQYYLFDQSTAQLLTSSLQNPTPKVYASNVLAFKSYGDNVMLYVTTDGAPASHVVVKWQDGATTYTLRALPFGGPYFVNLTQYSGDWYAAIAAASEGRVYIYKNPISMLQSQKLAVPAYELKIPNVNYVSFSSDARFIVAENGDQFGIYDNMNKKGYAYILGDHPLDTPALHATWFDGAHLSYISGGKATVFDFDGANLQTLNEANSSFPPMFDRDYEFLFSLSQTNGSTSLNKTALRIPADL